MIYVTRSYIPVFFLMIQIFFCHITYTDDCPVLQSDITNHMKLKAGKTEFFLPPENLCADLKLSFITWYFAYMKEYNIFLHSQLYFHWHIIYFLML